jgi:hypothetical protein
LTLNIISQSLETDIKKKQTLLNLFEKIFRIVIKVLDIEIKELILKKGKEDNIDYMGLLLFVLLLKQH